MLTFVTPDQIDNLFDFDQSGIIQACETANQDKSDPVFFEARSKDGLARLLSTFGIQELPRTHGELMGALWYCKLVHTYAQVPPGLGVAAAKDWLEVTDEVLGDTYPELLSPIQAYREKDGLKLQRIARVLFPLETLARHYSVGQGWTSSRQLTAAAPKTR